MIIRHTGRISYNGNKRFMTDFLLIKSFLLLKYKIFCAAHIVVSLSFVVVCGNCCIGF